MKVNKQVIDIDEQTAIGITFQAYDIKEPGKRKANYSNTFSIPKTSHNLSLFGYPDNPYSTSLAIYDLFEFEYWQGAKQLIKNGKVRIEQISDRISLYVVDKISLWDELKLVTWEQFQSDYLEWLTYNNYINGSNNPDVGNFDAWLIQFVETNEHILLPAYVGNHLQLKDVNGYYIEDASNLWLNYKTSNGGHFCAYSKSIFQFIEAKFGVNLLTSGGIIPGNIWDDEYAPRIYTPIRNIGVRYKYNSQTGAGEGWYIGPTNSNFEPLEEAKDKQDKTLYDYVNGFFQHFNVLIDEFDDYIRIARWDDIEQAGIVNWSGKIDANVKQVFKPKFGDYSQQNTIKFGSIYENGSELTNSRTLTSNNKNLDAKSDLFTIDANISTFIQTNGGVIPNLSDSSNFETFQYFVSGYESPGVFQKTTSTILVQFDDGVTVGRATLYLQIPSYYSLSGEYRFLDSILKYPIFRELSLWLTIKDINQLEFFKQYYFEELGGSYFINKISGFNPEKSTTSTKCELIFLSNRTPVTPPDLDYYTDGIGDGFTDGENDLFY